MEEVWKDIEGYEGIYQVSNLGNVKSLNYVRMGIEKVLKPKKHNKGYLQVQLTAKKDKTFTIHRLVAKAFIPNPDNLPLINHKDENKQNNRAENLEWCNYSYNSMYSRKLHPERAKRSFILGDLKINQYSKEGELLKTWDNSRQIFVETKMSDWAISECCRGNRKSAYGYIWQYANENILLAETQV